MMQVSQLIKIQAQKAFAALYNLEVGLTDITLNETKPEFEGDYTIVMFSFVKQLRKSPDALCNEVGEWLVNNNQGLFSSYNVIKGFLNLVISDTYWLQFLADNRRTDFGYLPANGKKAMIEYSSPNTNKPLHLGHLRNNFLGWSVAEIYKANGWDVQKTCIVNDRGVHICKSMLAWQKFGNGSTPGTTNTKGDHFVGNYYVKFENALQTEAKEVEAAIAAGNTPENIDAETLAKAKRLQEIVAENADADKVSEAKIALKDIYRNVTPIMQEVRRMLLKWEEGDAETLKLWSTMNGWVYEGFDTTYKRIGSDFDKTYYESNTYLLGKDFVAAGLEKGVFYKKEDGSVWIDLTEDGLDEKLVLRKDGTSVYITQDIGLAEKKYEDFPMDVSLYVIGDEQNYHMKVLQLICKKLGMPFADGIFHLSYGMVDLPTGRMKSREGTVVDADDLCDEMERVAGEKTEELGKVKDFTEDELKQLYKTLGLGALKFYLLRVDPKKRMVFNPEESIDFQGFTGTFVQFSHARLKAILRKNEAEPQAFDATAALLPAEKKLIVELEKFTAIIAQAGEEMNPSVIAAYLFNVAKTFNSFVTELRVLQAESDDKKQLRLSISQLTGIVIKNGMALLGIAVPERM